MTSTRRNLWIPDELWERAKQAAREQGVRENRDVSLSDWIREAIRQQLEQRRT